MNYSQQVQEAVSKLTAGQQQYFNVLISGADKDPFKSVKDINTGVAVGGSIEREHHAAAVLARTAIQAALDGRPEAPELDNQRTALKLIREKIADAETAGDTEQAERYKAGIAKLADKEEKAAERAAKAQVQLEKLKASNKAQNIERYLTAFATVKDTEVQNLRNARMDAQAAEEHFAKYKATALTESLQRSHGVSRAEIDAYELEH
jgi:hypothetical protein